MSKPLDLLVVGGGIYGLWIAADAAGRGLRTALVEQGDFGGATSCASSKLIHGGLRYLERFELGLVRHSLAERRLLTELAPHRVRTLRFAVPIYKDGRFGAFSLRMGLWLYDRLAGSRADLGGRQREPLEDLEARCPWLRTDGLSSAFSYADAQTDDARFTRDVVRIARNAGAQLRIESSVRRSRTAALMNPARYVQPPAHWPPVHGRQRSCPKTHPFPHRVGRRVFTSHSPVSGWSMHFY
jgi:glycerol-3-phosphate dehydrogenase